ncbi:hypothetical protein [Moorena sp. SIO4G3]|uniref:hypothetical protein n=1 Tax=Moorena sp. SIO4G3 TaxID=2607821 RepID=UPI00142B944E|nr:hypothetical protein [Moorena sp. SIO4G3]NEO78601.1 hypothetical protein [Moorena sp. SIO4G3]
MFRRNRYTNADLSRKAIAKINFKNIGNIMDQKRTGSKKKEKALDFSDREFLK